MQSEDGTSGYQSTLDCKFFAAGGYLGEVSASKKAAEHSAARVAIEHEFRDFVEGVETLGKKKKGMLESTCIVIVALEDVFFCS